MKYPDRHNAQNSGPKYAAYTLCFGILGYHFEHFVAPGMWSFGPKNDKGGLEDEEGPLGVAKEEPTSRLGVRH